MACPNELNTFSIVVSLCFFLAFSFLFLRTLDKCRGQSGEDGKLFQNRLRNCPDL